MVLNGPNLLNSRPDFVKSIDFVEFTSNLGYVKMYLTSSESSDQVEYLMSSSVLNTSQNDGLLATNSTYGFYTPEFNTTQRVSGIAYVSGHLDYTSGAGCQLTAQLFAFNFANAGEGSVDYSDATEVTQAKTITPTLVKTVAVDDYVYQVKAQIKRDDNAHQDVVTHQYVYEDGGTFDFDESCTDTYVEHTHINPYPKKKVTSIKVYTSSNVNDPALIYEKETDVYGFDNINQRTISTQVSTPVTATDIGILIQLPITEQTISKSDVILLEITKSGGTGGYVLDPLNAIITEESLKLYLPFKVDL